MNYNSVDKRWWQSLQSPNSFIRQHRCNSPPVFQSNQSMATIDISCPVNNQGFCKQLSSYTEVSIFSSKHWAGSSPFLVALSILRVAALKSLAQRKCRRVNESESNEECNRLDWSWNFKIDVSETFLNLVVHYPLDFAPEWICQTLHIMGGKCQMFINVIRAPLKDFEWFSDFLAFPIPL